MDGIKSVKVEVSTTVLSETEERDSQEQKQNQVNQRESTLFKNLLKSKSEQRQEEKDTKPVKPEALRNPEKSPQKETTEKDQPIPITSSVSTQHSGEPAKSTNPKSPTAPHLEQQPAQEFSGEPAKSTNPKSPTTPHLEQQPAQEFSGEPAKSTNPKSPTTPHLEQQPAQELKVDPNTAPNHSTHPKTITPSPPPHISKHKLAAQKSHTIFKGKESIVQPQNDDALNSSHPPDVTPVSISPLSTEIVTPTSPNSTTPIPSYFSTTRSSKVIDQISSAAKRLMISQPSSSNDAPRMVIEFKDNILPATTMIVHKETDGSLQIIFECGATESRKFMQDYQSTIEKHVQKTTGVDIKIAITMNDDDNAQEERNQNQSQQQSSQEKEQE